MRKLILELMLLARKSPLQRLILKILVFCHNHSYHLISFFASSETKHPKHDIINYKKYFTDHIKPTDHILDIGCGSGLVSYACAQKAQKVIGVDISNKNIIKANKTYRHPHLKFIKADAITHNFSDSFDVIILSNVLEHIKDRIHFLKKISLLAPTILIRVPMITRDWISVYKKNEGFPYQLDDTHYIEYDLKSFKYEINYANLNIIESHVNFGELYAIVTKNKK